MLTTSHYEKNADEVSLLFTFHKLLWREKAITLQDQYIDVKRCLLLQGQGEDGFGLIN